MNKGLTHGWLIAFGLVGLIWACTLVVADEKAPMPTSSVTPPSAHANSARKASGNELAGHRARRYWRRYTSGRA